jgi:chromosome partitioning protein
MKTNVLANQKGGVGKSAVLAQLSYYLRLKRDLRVLVIDFDHQGNASKALKTGGVATVSKTTASYLFDQHITTIEDAPFVLIQADEALLNFERQPEKRSELASNLKGFLNAVDDKFDVCLIDTNPNPDIRMVASLAVANSVLSPIQLNQEAIDGIGALLNHKSVGVRKIKAAVNPGLDLIGILPNIVEPTPFQRQNFEALATHFAPLLIRANDKSNEFAFIRKSTAIAEAQASGQPVWELKKTSARDAWKEIEPFFELIGNRILGTEKQ